MTRTLNISLNVPDSYGIEELTRQLTEYGERLISRRNRLQKSKKRRSQTFLKGLSLPNESTDKELLRNTCRKNTVQHRALDPFYVHAH